MKIIVSNGQKGVRLPIALPLISTILSLWTPLFPNK